MKDQLRVANSPPKPLMIWDGECHFCRRWIERWHEITAGEVEYATYQENADRFPEIPREQFQRSVVYIDNSGQVFIAAEAVYRSLRCRSSKKWLWWNYQHIPGFAAVSELGYNFIARHRGFASAITQLLWGKDVRPPTYFWAHRWFLRALGLVYLIAFVSLWIQIDGLVGANGILPISDYLSLAHREIGYKTVWILPTLCWFNSSNGFLHFLCGSGVLFSLLLICRIAPAISLGVLFVSYLSLSVAGQAFLSFQWGALTALDYHYWTQPLPTVFAWFADKHPEWFKKFSVAFCLVVEIIVPFFIWAPRRPRLIAAGLLIFLQLAIAITGNYCFFNLLTIGLCLLLIDDATWRVVAAVAGRGYSNVVLRAAASDRGYNFAAIIVLIVTLPLNLWLCYTALKPEADWPKPLLVVYARIEPFRILNGYGLFRVMTKERLEIQVEGSADGIDWVSYEFKWKPGDLNRAPRRCAPH